MKLRLWIALHCVPRFSTVFGRKVRRSLLFTTTRFQSSTPINTSHDVTEEMKRQRPIDDDKPHFPGTWKSTYVDTMQFIKPELQDTIPIYRVLNWEGDIVNKSEEPNLGQDTILQMYKTMVKLHTMDKVLWSASEEGRIGLYIKCDGEEGANIGSAAALDFLDVIYAQYREQGVLMWRGFTVDQFIDQCIGNVRDGGRARQMSLHYGSRELNYVTISSPLATGMPQAAGTAYAMKRAGSKNCVACYFGDGAASMGDAHAAFNFASTMEVPVLYICRNNGYAISTCSDQQYRGDGIASRGAGYGMCSIRVDGNDTFAVYNAIKAAREIAMSESRPVLIELMTYRIANHSTNEDAVGYRKKEEIDFWSRYHPIDRLRKYITKMCWWDDEKDSEWLEETWKIVLDALDGAEAQLKPNPFEMFNDVYDEMPPRLRKQAESMQRHLKEHQKEYPLLEKYTPE
ncbi:2-oxoisovalerate dehydrogenase subunit alpha, mitochondrial-like [Ptychodera flava]|uniref:2-oxoisovalerate dehydrogenase subunit alpha, mitochondrial-like n=1 Tax=Ptychodera flava TaxID=63121 RepID=UPI003969D0C5